MKSRILILLVVLFASIASYNLFAQQTSIREQGEPPYTGPVSLCDTIILGDSIVVIHTICAPICSSCVRVYNKEGEWLGTLKSPIKTPFPEAYIEEGKIIWRDNDPNDYTPAP